MSNPKQPIGFWRVKTIKFYYFLIFGSSELCEPLKTISHKSPYNLWYVELVFSKKGGIFNASLQMIDLGYN